MRISNSFSFKKHEKNHFAALFSEPDETPSVANQHGHFSVPHNHNARTAATTRIAPDLPRRTPKGSDGFLCPGCGVLVPVGCPCPLPFGARPMPVPATLRCPPNYSFLGVLLLVGYPYPLCAPTRPTTRSSAACSYSPATPTRFVLLPVRYPRPPDARAFPLPVPAACPCPYSSVCSVALLRLRHHATSRARAMARGPRAATF